MESINQSLYFNLSFKRASNEIDVKSISKLNNQMVIYEVYWSLFYLKMSVI